MLDVVFIPEFVFFSLPSKAQVAQAVQLVLVFIPWLARFY